MRPNGAGVQRNADSDAALVQCRSFSDYLISMSFPPGSFGLRWSL